MHSLERVDVKNKRVLVRADFNVPIDKNGELIDDTRIRESLPTLNYLVDKGALVIVLSHLGRPKGKVVESLKMDRVAQHLSRLMERPVVKTGDCIGPEVKQAIANAKPGDVIMLENVRFHPEEEQNDPEFARQLAELGDIFVNDAFGTAHRAHASVSGIADYLPCFPGFLLENEVIMLKRVMNGAEKPRVAIVGGAKVGDKLQLLENLLSKMDVIIIGGGMANTFLKARGFSIGKSICEDSLLSVAAEIMKKAEDLKVSILLPIDVMVADSFSEQASSQVVKVDEVPDESIIMDIGPDTINLYRDSIVQARTILWNGPMGVYEFKPFARGTEEVARAVASSSAVSVVGGGDSLATIYHLGLQSQITHVSTGGGATLEFLEGKKLPGIEAAQLL